MTCQRLDNERNAQLVSKVGGELEKELGISLDRGYFFFSDAKAADIGFKGTTFENIFKGRA